MADRHFFSKPELQALEDEYGTGYVIIAFNVQDKIGAEGIEDIRFMEKMENYLKQVGRAVTPRRSRGTSASN